MIDFAVVALLASGAAGAIWLAARSRARREELEREAWERARRLVGAEIDEHGSDTHRVMRLEVDGVRLVVRGTMDLGGDAGTRTTTVSAAPLRGGWGVRLEANPRGAASKLARPILAATLGKESATDDDAFDAAFAVSSSPKALAREVLDAALRRALLDAGQGFTVRDAELTLACEGAPDDAAPLVSFIRFAERIVRSWNDCVDGPSRVARALGWIDEQKARLDGGEWCVARGSRRGRACELLVRFRDAWALSVVRLPRAELSSASAGDEPWSIVRNAEAPGGWSESGRVPESLRQMAFAAPRVLVGVRLDEAGLELAFDGLRPRPDDVLRILDASISTIAPPSMYR